jgi:ABC-type phosphate/phosphonate transport system substrate-binding protein
MRLANLPMYDLAPIRDATDAWWAGLAGHFRAAGLDGVPETLSRGGDLTAQCRSPELMFTQTCGYPLTHDLVGAVRVIATPCYQASGCSGADYLSVILIGDDSPAARLEDLRGGRCAINNLDSQSGFNALRALVAPMGDGKPFFGEIVVSGSHLESAPMVGRGEADLASLDCVTYTLLAVHDPERLAGTRVLCETESVPGLPYVTAATTSDDELNRLRQGLAAACADPALAEARSMLLLAGVEVLAETAYDRILDMERIARAQGGGDLA